MAYPNRRSQAANLQGCRTPLRSPSLASLPPVPLPTGIAFGLVSKFTILFSIAVLFANLVTDVLLALALWKQAVNEPDEWAKRQATAWFFATVGIMIIPNVIVNILSLVWYWQNKKSLGEYAFFSSMNCCQVFLRHLCHFALLGPFVRYLDTLWYGRQLEHHVLKLALDGLSQVRRRMPREEGGPPSYRHRRSRYAVVHQIILRDTALLDMMRSFLQDCPQLLFQFFLLYISPAVVTPQIHNRQLIVGIQLLKVLCGMFAVSWTIVSFQEELRWSLPNKAPTSCGATITCLIWSATMLASRIIAVASFGALQVTPEGGLVKTISDDPSRGMVISFPGIAGLVLLFHWIIMTAWTHAQQTNFCRNEEGRKRPFQEFLYVVFMGFVHIFSYINIKDTPSRRRMVFFYIMLFIEDTAFIVVWYLQVITQALWLRVLVVFVTEALFVIGIGCLLGYYGFLHPQKDLPTTHSSTLSLRK